MRNGGGWLEVEESWSERWEGFMGRWMMVNSFMGK